MSTRDDTSNNRALLYRVVIYFLGNICSKLITFFLTRLQTQTMDPAEFGPANLLNNTLPHLVSICFFEMWAGLLRFMYDEKEAADKHRVFTNTLLACVPLFPLFLLATYFLNRSQQTSFMLELTVMGVLYLLDYVYQFTVRGMGRNKLFAIAGVVSSFVLGITQFLFLSILDLGMVSLILSPICASGVSVLIYEISTRQMVRMRRSEIDWGFIKGLWRFSFPLSINATAFVALTKFNEFFIQIQFDNASLGYLMAANKLATIVNLFVTVFSLAWQETAFSLSADEKRGAYFSATLGHYLKMLGVGVFLLIAFGKLIYKILIGGGGAYDAVYELIPASLIAVAISALSNFMGHIFGAEKRNDQLLYSTIAGAVVNILSMYLLLPIFHLQAANIALGLGFLMTFVYRYIMIQRTIRIHLPLRLVVLAVIGVTINTVVFFHVQSKWALLVFMVVSFIIATFVLRREIRNLYSLLTQRVKLKRG